MRQTTDILKQLETQYFNIEYYHTIVEKIEENVISNPDIAIESCKSLFEGLGKFIILNIDKSLNFGIVDNFKYKRAITKAVELLETKDPEFESDFSKKLLDVLDMIGNIRNDRGDISHGRLSPKPEQSDTHFSNFVMALTDSFASYLLISFSKVSIVKELAYEDFPEFNEKLDIENQVGLLRSYSKALFDQDPVAYEEELENYLNDKETVSEDV